MSDAPEVYETDQGRLRVHGFKVAEIRQNGVAVMAIATEGGTDLRFIILMEEEDGSLHFVTRISGADDLAVGRSTLLFRVISKLVFDNYDVENVKPDLIVREEDEWKGTGIVPGLTPWGRG